MEKERKIQTKAARQAEELESEAPSELLLAVEEIVTVRARAEVMRSDGGTSGRSDTND